MRKPADNIQIIDITAIAQPLLASLVDPSSRNKTEKFIINPSKWTYCYERKHRVFPRAPKPVYEGEVNK